MSLYSKALRHINMDRVKELREENIKKQKLAEEKLQEEILRAHVEMIRAHYSKHYDWRSDLIEEGMTTSGMGMINLEPTGENVTSINSDQASIPGFTNDGTLSGGTWTMNNAPDPENAAVTIALTADLSRFDTITPSVAFNNATIDPAHGMDLVFNGPSGSGLSHVVSLAPGSSGFTNGIVSFPINIPSNLRIKGVTISYTVVGNGGEEGDRFIGSNAIRITSTIPNRRRPMSILVSLDDPEATAFIRDTLGNENLSPAQKKKKLEQMLGASAEYLTKMFGEGIFTGASEISDVQVPQSFMDIMVGDQQITQQDGNTITDTTRGIEDGMMDGEPFNPQQQQQNNQQQNNQQDTQFKLLPQFRDKSAAFLGGYVQDASIEQLEAEFAGTDVNIKALKAYARNLRSINSQIDRYGRSSNYTEEGMQRLIDLRNNEQERIKAEIEGAKPNIVPISEPPKPTDDRAEIEKNIKDSLKQLEIDSEQLKGENLQRNINMAIDLGLDILTVVTLLSPIPGDEAAALSAQAAKAGIKTGAKTAAQKAAIKKAKKDAIWKSYGSPKSTGRPGISRGKGMGDRWEGPLSNSYKPEGEVIVEKKKLKSPKSLLDKIPGYYDGKPAPLGFPIEEPPKMKNGMHPDLVDGKKVANRYNRLDPTSAKAMPKTGNPHIDRKVKAAAKNPK